MHHKLYDGLHAKSEVKSLWFKQVVAAFQHEIEFTKKDIAEPLTPLIYEPICSSEDESHYKDFTSESDSESDSDTPWKRKKAFLRCKSNIQPCDAQHGTPN